MISIRWHRLLLHYLLPVFFISLLSVLVYSNIFPNQLVWDDYFFIGGWSQVQNFDSLGVLIDGSVPVGIGSNFRPLRSFFYVILFQLSGTNPFGYHLLSILINTATGITVFFILNKLTRHSLASFLAALIFTLHPTHVEAVTWMTAVFDTIGSLAFFLSFLFYLFQDKKLFRNLSIFFAITAFFTYELTLSLPIILFAYEWLVAKTKGLKKIYSKLKPIIYANLTFWLLRFLLLEPSSSTPLILNSRVATFLVMLVALAKYLLLLLLPINLTINHPLIGPVTANYPKDFDLLAAPELTSIITPTLFISTIIVLTLLLLAWRFRKNSSLTTFSIIFFFSSLLPVMQLFPQPTIFAEKYLYIASFAYSLFIAIVLKHILYKSKHQPHLVISVLALYLIFFSYQTYQRNRDWQNSTKLWESAATYTPQSPFVLRNLAGSYFLSNQYEKSLQTFDKLIEISPNHPEDYIKRGYIHLVNNPLKALFDLRTSLELYPHNYVAYNLLGDAHLKLGNQREALIAYQQSAQINPNDSYALNKLLILQNQISPQEEF